MTRALALSQISVRSIVIGIVGLAVSIAFFNIALPKAHAAGLTASQVGSVVSLLQSYNVDQSTINKVQIDLAGASVSAPGSIAVSADSSSPAYQIVAGGAVGVQLGAFDITAAGENVTLSKIGLTLASGLPGDVKTIYLYSGTNLLGTATFGGNSTFATSTLLSPVSIGAGANVQVTLKADMGVVGTAAPAAAGDLVQISVSGAQGLDLNSGALVAEYKGPVSTGAGVRIFKSYPTIAQVQLPSATITGSNQSLLRFSITASPNGPIGLNEIALALVASGAVNVSNFGWYGYTDSNFSQPIAGQAGGLIGAGVAPSATTGVRFFMTSGSNPIEIPAGATYYFDIRGTVSSTGSASLTTQLYGDSTYSGLFQTGTTANGNFQWSSNDNGTSQSTTNDWTNGYGIPGLPANGISQTLAASASTVKQVPTSMSPTDFVGTCSPSGTSVTFTWSPVAGVTNYLPFVQDFSNGSAYLPPNLATSFAFKTSPYTVSVTPGHKIVGYIYGYTSSGQQLAPHIAPTVLCAAPSAAYVNDTMKPATPAPTCTLTATPATVKAGQSVTLTWTSTNATSASMPNGAVGSTTGSIVLSPAQTAAYQKTVYGPGGTGTCEASVTVGATAPATAPVQAAAWDPSNLTASALNALYITDDTFSPPSLGQAAAVVLSAPVKILLDGFTDYFVQMGVH